MFLTIRRDYLIASYLYFAALAVNLVLTFHTVYRLFVSFSARSGDHISGGAVLSLCTLFLILFIWMGFGIRAGKSWAKALFLAYAAWNIFSFLRVVPSLLHSDINCWAVLRNLLSTVMLLSICYFLFRNNFIRRPTAPVAQGLVE